jgi:hypothetical protein
MAPLSVDPAALSGAGAAVISAGDGVAAATSALSSGFGANTGQDSAGEAFALSYQDSAESLLKAVAAGINAYRTVGFKLELGASNYSRAEASSTLGGGAAALPTPTAPGIFDAPGAPWTLGPGIAEPALWAFVEEFVGDLWPNGNPGQIHAAATCWRNFGAAIHSAKNVLQQPDSTIAAQHIPEGELIQQAFSKLGDAMVKVGDECGKLAKGLDDFANEVQHTQDAIRDLLHRLDTPSGLLHEVVQVFKGHGLDEIKKIADDIKAVLHNMKREADAKEQLFQKAEGLMDSCAVSLEAFAKKELTQYLGNNVGSAASAYFDAEVDIGEGLVKGAADAAHSLSQLNPLRFAYDPKGALSTWQGVEKLATMAANPTSAFATLASDPKGTLDMVKGLDDFTDWSSDRPLVGLGHNIFDAGTAVLPGVGEVGAGAKAAETTSAATRAADAADVAGSVGRDERLIDEVGEFASTTGTMGDVGGTASGLTKDLDKIGADFPKGDPPPAGRPASLMPPKPGEPGAGPPPSRVEPAPTVSTPADPQPGPPAIGRATAPTTAADATPAPSGVHQPAPALAGPESAPSAAAEAGPHPSYGAEPSLHAAAPSESSVADVHSTQPAISPPRQMALQDAHPTAGQVPDTLPSADAWPPAGRDGGADGSGSFIGGHDRNTGGGSPSTGAHPGGGDGGRPTENEPPKSGGPHGGEDYGGHLSDGEPPNLDGPGDQPPPPLHRDEPLPGEDLLDQYKGENDPDNPNRYFRPKTVDYLSPEDLERHRLFVRDGLLYSVRDGLPFDTRSAGTVWSQGRAIYVMDRHGNLYASLKQVVGEFHHSSLLAGEPVAGAGELEVVDGVPTLINRKSGHYQPDEDQLSSVRDMLQEQGIDISRILFGAGF